METNKIIITGGAARIGAAIAKKLSAPGVEIVIHYNKSKAHAEKLKKELSKNSTKVYLIKGDLSKENDLKKIVKFSNLSFSNNEALFIKQSKYFNFFLQNLTIFFKSASLLKSPLTKYTIVEFFDNSFFNFSAFDFDLL